MLARAGSLKTSHVEAFEIAMQDQDKISGALDIAGLQMSAYCQQGGTQNVAQSTMTHKHKRTMTRMNPCQNACRGCSSMVELNQVTGL